jgi:hypothetical protein
MATRRPRQEAMQTGGMRFAYRVTYTFHDGTTLVQPSASGRMAYPQPYRALSGAFSSVSKALMPRLHRERPTAVLIEVVRDDGVVVWGPKLLLIADLWKGRV